MENSNHPRPVLLALAGPNGSGKSTITGGIPVVGARLRCAMSVCADAES
jgi:predicted ABC-type ATPase